MSLIGKGMQSAAQSIGWTASVLDSNLNPGQQVSNIQTFLQQHDAAIASWTLDSGATAGVYAQAEAAGVPVIGVNSEGSGVAVSVFSQIQECAPGGTADQTASLIAKAHPHGQVITISIDSVPSWAAITKCFEAAAKAQGLTVVAHKSNESDNSSGAATIVQSLLTKYPNVNAVWAYNDASALGASAAVISSGRKVSNGGPNGVIVTGENGDADAIQAIRDGRLTGTWDINSVELGWLIVDVMKQKLAGSTVPKTVVLRSTFWDSGNVGKYVTPAERKVSFDNLDIVK